MKHLLLFTAILFIYGCGGPSTTPISIDQLAKNKNATIGELNQIFRANTKYHNPDNSYLIFNFQSIKKHSTYVTNDGQTNTNVIVIETVTPKGDNSTNKLYLDSVGYFVLFDEFGNEYYENLGSGTQTGTNFGEILLFAETDITKFKYILMGELDHQKNNGLKSMVFEIK